MVHRVARAFGLEPARVYVQPYARTLYAYFLLGLMERQEAAQRAIEREEEVYGFAYASHDPSKLSEWRTDLRRRVGLSEKPKRDPEAQQRMNAAMQAAQVVELGPDFLPVRPKELPPGP